MEKPCTTVTSLKELLEVRIDALEKITDERFQSANVALELNANEISRRLELLNGEAERLRQMSITYVPRETLDLLIKTVNEKVDSLRDSRSESKGSINVYTFFIPILVSVGVVLLAQAFHI